MSSCFDCGSPVTPEDRFCGNCGMALQPAPGAAGGAASSSVHLTQDGGEADSPAPEPEASGYVEELQPTLIEPSRGGQAAAPARASEPAETTGAPEPSAAADSKGLSTAGSAELSSAVAEDVEITADTSDEPPTGAVPVGEPSADETAPGSAEQGAGGGAPAADVRGRRTGDLPSRPMAYTGRTGGTSSSGRRSSASQLEPGTVLYSRYEIVKRIGGGGMGAVYYAKDRNLGDAPRAVKEMIQTHLDESQQEKAVADFRRESMLLASLEHPSIPTIYDYFYDDAASRFYLVMKYISGGDCLARLRNAPMNRLDELTVAEWGSQAADVLEYLHNQRPPIIYRDLKPANLMIDGNSGRVMLIDFGIARWVAPQEKGVTAVGTMGYAPPELFSGKAEPRTDIYGLGATMFHLLTGSDPQDNPLLIFDFTKNPTPRQINPAVSNEMEWILMRAVEYEPERRFRTAAEMRDTLQQHVERLRAGAVTYGVVRGAQEQTARTMAVERVFCGFCGKSISSEDVFCPHCGARQPIAAASAALRTARATARLVVTGTTELDTTFLLNKETNLVGRTDPQSNIFPDIDLSRFDPETKISRRHARVWREGDTFLVEDLGSVNGTVVNEAVRLGPRQPRPLANGDRLRLGETTLHFLIG
ncbi:MAG TPA: protein kinase [Pyrinomonadaceae bacterium]|jgi:serine/threonine-protein kinase